MVSRVSGISIHRDVVELGIDDDEVLRESAVPDQTARLAGAGGLRIQGGSKLSHIAVCDHAPKYGALAQRRGSGYRRAVNSSRSEIEPVEHLIKQRRIAAGACDIESVEDPVLENIDRVKRNSSPEPRSLAA